MWNIKNRKWVPVFTLVLSMFILITSIFAYIIKYTHNILIYNIDQDILNILCILLGIAALVMFVSSINFILFRRFYIESGKSVQNDSSTSPLSVEDVEVDYTFDNGIITLKYDNTVLPMSLEALRQIIDINEYVHSDDKYILDECFNSIKNQQENFSFELRAKYKTDNYNKYRINSTLLYNKLNKPYGLTLTFEPIPNQSQLSNNIVLNQRDSLTSLYDFSTFRQLVTDLISNNRPLNKKHYILIIDIDNFDILNDKFGKDFANILLACFSNQLSRILSKDDLLSYVYNNKFIVYINNQNSIDNIDNICKCINNIFTSMLPDCETPTITCNLSTIDHNKSLAFDKVLETAGININNISSLYKLPMLDNSRITYSVVNLFNDSHNLQLSLNTALNLIGHIYNLDVLSIYELNSNDDSIEANFAWYNDSFIKHASLIDKVHKPNYENFILYNDSQNNIFSTNDLSSVLMQSSSFKYALLDAGCNCLYQKKISYNGKFNGFILAASSNECSNWNDDVCNSLTLLSSIIINNLEKLRTQQSIKKMITIDNLTGANNLKSFSTIVENLIKQYPTRKYAMIYFDIDRFTLINEHHGYTTGDCILKTISHTLDNVLEDYESFCRIVDDKFVVFAEYLSLENIKHRMLDFKECVHKITDDNNNNLKINLTAGIALFTGTSHISQIIDEANIARRSVKHKHNSNYAFFNDAMRNKQLKMKNLEDVMEDALANNEFCLYLQPKYNVIEQCVCGAEALVRWERPDYGTVPPNEFVPIFEENSFIIEIDYYIFDRVCELIRNLLDEGKRPVPISVNFSRLHLNNTKILDKLKSNLKKYNLTPEFIEIEITESALADSDVYMNSILNEIHRLGFKLAMDDFGTGLSSLNSLRKLPFDILKLDKDFFQKDHITKRERIVISNIVRLGKELAMSIVSEGVETSEQIDFLKDIQCPVIQGYFFSKPIHYNEFINKYFS